MQERSNEARNDLLAMSTAALCATCLLAPVAPSQGLVLPRIHAASPGDAVVDIFKRASSRLQQVSGETRGTARIIRSIAFRRGSVDGRIDRHQTQLTIRLGDGDITNFTGTFAQNWIGTPSVVHAAKTVSLPNWSPALDALPAPFDFRVKLDRAYSYSGQHDLVFELAVDGPSASSFRGADSTQQRANGDMPGTSQRFGAGCTVGTFNLQGDVSIFARRNGQDSDAFCAIANAPANRPAFLILGGSNPKLSIPGVCGVLTASLDLFVPIGSTNDRGLASQRIRFGPYSGALAGTKLYGQILVFDPPAASQLLLSNGVLIVLPRRSFGPVTGRFAEAWFSSKANQATRVVNGALIVQLD